MKRVKFIICADARTGSHMLQTAINKHKDITCYGEILNSKSEDSFLNDMIPQVAVISAFKSHNLCSGFIIHRTRKDLPQIWRMLVMDPEIKVIFIHRRNQLLRYASLLIARESKQWIDLKGKGQSKEKIYFEGNEYHKEVTLYHRRFNYYKNLFKQHEMIQIDYEDMNDDFQKELKKVLSFLGVNYRKLVPVTYKQEHRTPKEIFTNYNAKEEL